MARGSGIQAAKVMPSSSIVDAVAIPRPIPSGYPGGTPWALSRALKNAPHDAERGCREDQTILRGPQPYDVDQEQRRARDIREQGTECGAIDQYVAEAERVPQHTQVVAGNSVRCEPGRRVQGRAFGKPSSMASSRRAPIAASTVWMARQPPMSSSAAPAVGASVGTVIVAMAIWENFVRAVAPSNRSRMMARAIVMLAPAPAP